MRNPFILIEAVVVNYNSRGTALDVIRALERQTYPVASITVIDNCSTDDTPSRIARQFPAVRLVRLDENVGLSRARNLGLRTAQSDLVLLVDDDVYPEPHCLERLLAAQQRTAAPALAPRILHHPVADSVQCDGAAIHFAGMLNLLNAGGSPARIPEALPVGAFIGACLLLERRVVLALDGFDEDYFFYFEDLELSYRLRGLGHAIYCEPRAAALHDRGAGTAGLSFRGAGAYPARRAYFVLRHRWLTVLLHYQARTLLLLVPALALYELASLAECLRRGWLARWAQAAWWICANLGRILRRRRRWQSQRRIPDAEILSGGPLPFAAGLVSAAPLIRLVRLLDRTLNGYWNLVKRWL